MIVVAAQIATFLLSVKHFLASINTPRQLKTKLSNFAPTKRYFASGIGKFTLIYRSTQSMMPFWLLKASEGAQNAPSPR